MEVRNNATQPAFQGKYLLKGGVGTVEKAIKKIADNVKTNYVYASPKLLKDQKYVKALVLTGDDAPILNKYYVARQSSINPFGDAVIWQGIGGRPNTYLHIDDDRISKKIVEDANEKASAGNPRPLKKIVDEDATNTFKKIEFFTDYNLDGIEELSAAAALKAMKNGEFKY